MGEDCAIPNLPLVKLNNRFIDKHKKLYGMVGIGTIHEVIMMHGKIVYWLTVTHFANEDFTNGDT